MEKNEQIVIVGTGFWPSLNMYMASMRHHHDHPAYIIRRDGTLEHGGGYGHVVAVENVGPVVQDGDQWLPAQMNKEGKFRPIPGAAPVRAPYEFCSCKPYHGCQHYEYIHDKQLATLKEVIVRWLSEFSIRYPYDNQLGTVCPRAQAGKSGIYFASSFEASRSDIHPQKEITDIIKAYAS